MNLITSYNKVYFVDTNDKHFGRIAIRPRFFSDRAEWEDTSRGKVLFFDRLLTPLREEAPAEIAIETPEGVVTLCILTLPIYNEKVKPYAWGSPSFGSDEELQEFYLNSYFAK